jgi:hypothetical protein
MQKERHEYAIQLEHLRDALRRTSEEQLASLKLQLDIARETYLREHLDRVIIYRAAVDPIVEIVGKIEMILQNRRGSLAPDELYDFEVKRLRAYTYPAMHAPQSVMDAYDAVVDLVLAVIHDNQMPTCGQLRDLALKFLNEVRKDIGIRPDPITYGGSR